jgi:hypothetical protein
MGVKTRRIWPIRAVKRRTIVSFRHLCTPLSNSVYHIGIWRFLRIPLRATSNSNRMVSISFSLSLSLSLLSSGLVSSLVLAQMETFTATPLYLPFNDVGRLYALPRPTVTVGHGCRAQSAARFHRKTFGLFGHIASENMLCNCH